MREAALALALFIGTAARADVIVGVSAPLAGASQVLGQQMLGGVKAEETALNANGGIAGEAVTVVTADDGCDATRAATAAQTLIAAKVDVVIGPLCSTAALAAAPVFAKAGVLMILPSATAPAITESGFSNVIRIAPRSDAQGAFAARRIRLRRPNAVMALVDDGSAAMKAITASFAAAYGKAPALAESFAAGASDFSALIDKMKAARIDTIYIAAGAIDSGKLLAAMAAAGLATKHYGPDTLLDGAFWQAGSAAAESTLVSFPSDPQDAPAARKLAQDFKAKGIDAGGPALPASAALELFSEVATYAGSAHDTAAILAALKSGESFDTAIGPFRFDAKGDAQDLRFTWHSWNNGQVQAIAPEGP